MISTDRPRTSMVLSGGGGYGAYEVGVMLALFRGESPATGGKPLVVDLFSGTSIGSYNAAVMTAHSHLGFAVAAERLVDIWLHRLAQPEGACTNGVFRLRGAAAFMPWCLTRPSGLQGLMDDGLYALSQFLPRAERFSRVVTSSSPDPLTRAILIEIDFTTLLDLSPFVESIAATVPLDGLRAAEVELQVVASNFATGGADVFSKDDIAGHEGYAAILASSAIPGLFPPVSLHGNLYLDGGTLMNTPVLPAVHSTSELHVAYINPPLGTIPIESLRSTVGVVDRLRATSFAFAVNQDVETISDFDLSLSLLDAPELLDPDLAAAGAAVKTWLKTNPCFKPSTIHRYFPARDLGGPIGFLDLGYQQVSALIEQGYEDAARHDCVANGCTVAGRVKT